MSTKSAAFEEPQVENVESYRTVSKYAVFSLVLSFMSLLGLIHPVLTIFGLVAVIFGIMALVGIAHYPHELMGRPAAWMGMAIGSLLFFGGVGLHTYVYLTEVPDGYERISWSEMQPKLGSVYPIPERAGELHETSVFIKGYVHPGVDGRGPVQDFVLVRDMGVCCFGGQPKLTDMMEVRVLCEPGVRYSMRRIAVAGTLKVSLSGSQAAGGLDGGYYQLEAEFVK